MPLRSPLLYFKDVPLKKKVYLNCPKCFSRINHRKNIGDIGVCEKCSWAGSYESENHEDWIQFKVSAALIVFGLILAFGVIRLKTVTPHVSKQAVQELTNAPSSPTLQRAQRTN